MNVEPNLAQGDEFYAALVALHDGLDASESLRLNARIILLLANQIGDAQLLREILDDAGRSVRSARQG